MTLTYGSVCSGIEAATAAWHPLGWTPAFFSEIEAFPRAVLAHHYPETPLHGDFTTIQSGDYQPIDLLVGGTPCQSFSVAGLRGGLDDDRGNLAFEYLRLADRLRPRWLVWENVPGVLSSNGGRDFGAILGGMVELGYGIAYRVLDAQFFGLAQRRKRVFVVGYLGDWRRAAAVLFELNGLSGNPAPSRKAGQGVTHPVAPSLTSSGRGVERGGDTRGQDSVVAVDVSPTLTAGGNSTGGDRPPGTTVDTCETLVFMQQPVTMSLGQANAEIGVDGVAATLNCLHEAPIIAHTLRGAGFDASEDGSGRGTPIVPAAVYGAQGTPGGGASVPMIAHTAVRRLTPVECERLQGFPNGFTAIPWRGKPADQCLDGPRYKALGNSMAVPVMAWIGRRIQMVEKLA